MNVANLKIFSAFTYRALLDAKEKFGRQKFSTFECMMGNNHENNLLEQG